MVLAPLRQKGDTKAGDAESCLPHFHSAIDDDIHAGYGRPFNDAVATQFLIRVNTLNL
jgi:hypothetical protein